VWRLAALGSSVACGIAVWGLAASQSACQLKGICDISTTYVPAPPSGSSGTAQPFEDSAGMYGDAWQSSAIEGTWMTFPGQITYVIYPKLADGGPFTGPYEPTANISADPDPGANAASNYAPSAGNATQLSALPDGGLDGIQVTNNTCTPYYLWLKLEKQPPRTEPSDASDVSDAASASDSFDAGDALTALDASDAAND